MDDDAPGLGAEFVINTAGAFAELMKFAQFYDDNTISVLRQAAQIEKATEGMIKLSAPTAQIAAFAGASTTALGEVGAAMRAIGPAATQSAETASRTVKQLEKDIGRLTVALGKEADATGRTFEQRRQLQIEGLKADATAKGMTDAVERLTAAELRLHSARDGLALPAREAAIASEAEAQAIRSATLAYNQFEAAARRGMVVLREQEAAEAALAKSSEAARLRNQAASAELAARAHAQLAAQLLASRTAMEADAVAAERMRAATDPLYAATSRLNAEIAESTRLYQVGATAPAEYARQQEVLTGRLRALSVEHDAMAAAVRRGSGSLTGASAR